MTLTSKHDGIIACTCAILTSNNFTTRLAIDYFLQLKLECVEYAIDGIKIGYSPVMSD